MENAKVLMKAKLAINAQENLTLWEKRWNEFMKLAHLFSVACAEFAGLGSDFLLDRSW